jgi:transcriptional regulator of acetoin/glycerol metabolism
VDVVKCEFGGEITNRRRSAMSTFLRVKRKPSGIIVPLHEVTRRIIVDALDKCGGNYCLAARLLGLGKSTVYRLAKEYNYQPPTVQALSLLTVTKHCPSQYKS